MKKQTLIIIIILAVAVAAIVIGSYFFPPVKSDDSVGTIGKAEKFRKGQFTAEDILLRDDILNDTAAVGKTLDKILSFNSFVVQEKFIIDSLWIKEIRKNCNACDGSVKLLQDYSSFLQNNLEVVKTTSDILVKAYNGQQKDFTFDVGVKILGFVHFVDEMISRDSIFNTVIQDVDQYIGKENPTDKSHKEQLLKLKEVRNHMVIDNLLFAMKTGDKKQTEVASSFTLSNGINLGIYESHGTLTANNTIGLVNDYITAAVVSNAHNLGLFSEGRLHSAVLGMLILGTEQGNIVVNNANELSVIGLTDLGVVKNNETLRNVLGVSYSNIIQSAQLGIIQSSAGTIFNTQNLSNILL